MSKGIAIETILLLLVGIIVVGVIVYLVYTYATGKTLSAYECRAKMVSWCTNCFNVASGSSTWPDNVNPLPTEISTCLSDTMGITLAANSHCSDGQATCKNFGVG